MFYRLSTCLVAVALCGPAQSAYSGSIRYELPNLLGEHEFDGNFNLFDAGQVVDTPFGFYEVEQARLVIQGRISSGMARGDGIIREATEFELLPSVGARPSFANSIEIQTEPTPESYRIETLYANPFVPETTPLPSPGGYPPVSFSVFLSVTPAFGTQYPPRLIDPPADTLTVYDGILVDVPIVAEIEQAYIVLSGASIVPEPGGLALLCGSLCLLVAARYRVGRYSVVALAAFLTVSDTCNAEFTFLPPTPYLSAADSPFPVLTNPTFNLEDFENDTGCVPGPGVFCGGGKFDAPGVNLIYGSTGLGSSVDADDGIIDGSGADGASGDSTPVFANPDLTFVFSAFEFEFDAGELGFLPTAVGFVVTDGAGPMSSITVFDANGDSAVLETNTLILDPNTTADDRFIGILNPLGISRVSYGKTTITSSGDISVPRIDHLQYGLFVPEPSTSVVLGLAAVFFGVCVAISRQRKSKGSVFAPFFRD